ncbi:MAG: phage baseplate assembly protein V [Gallionella sp.]|nr:phage baseplate assembly protein V [Gallionella sp.]
MSERMIARMLAPLACGLGNMLARGTVVLANAASKMQTLQVKLLSGEAKDGVEHFEGYGLTAKPHPGAECIALFFGGDRSNGVVIAVADRRYRLTGLAEGEVALYDDLGHKVHLTRTGIVINGGVHAINIIGNVIVTGDVIANGISLINHVHGGVQAGGSNTGAAQ